MGSSNRAGSGSTGRHCPWRGCPNRSTGSQIAFLTDIHHGPFTSLDYVSAVVRTTLVLRPDLIVLGGDYSLKDGQYIRPCLDVLSALTAPFGVYGVLGNHDYWHGVAETRAGLESRARGGARPTPACG